MKNGPTPVKRSLEDINEIFTKLPREIWLEIVQYLDPEDLDIFRSVCLAIQSLHENNSDMLWQPLLNRLHVIDGTIKTTSKSGTTIRSTFIEGFFKVLKNQAFEIDNILHYYPKETKDLGFAFTTEQPYTLKLLELHNKQLDEIHCAIIQEGIGNSSRDLNLDSKSLTRFPSQLLEGKNKSFFQNMLCLSLSDNSIELLPNNLELCQKLTTLNCSNNCLAALPSSIVKIKSLEQLIVPRNQIGLLPTGLETLEHLDYLICDHNNLKILPKGIFEILDRFTDFDFSDNLISDLPVPELDDRCIEFLLAQQISTQLLATRTKLHNYVEIWEPLITRLAHHNQFQRSPPYGELTLQEYFVQQFNELAANLATEILNILREHTDPEFLYDITVNDLIYDERLGSVTFKKITLNRLIHYAFELEAFNQNLIIDAIKNTIAHNSQHLDLSHLKITRIPGSMIIKDLAFWKNITSLDCSSNLMTALPNEICECTALKSILCNDNQLSHLPITLKDHKQLAYLDCRNNRLTSKPLLSDRVVLLETQQVEINIASKTKGLYFSRDSNQLQTVEENQIDMSETGPVNKAKL